MFITPNANQKVLYVVLFLSLRLSNTSRQTVAIRSNFRSSISGMSPWSTDPALCVTSLSQSSKTCIRHYQHVQSPASLASSGALALIADLVFL